MNIATKLLAKAAVGLFLLSSMEGVFALAIMAFLIHATGSVRGADLVQSAFWLSMMASELPTGYLTDRIGPRSAVLLSMGLRSLSLAFFYLNPGPWIILVAANIIEGVGLTVSTGTFSAYLKLASAAEGIALDSSLVSSRFTVARFAGFVFGGIAGTLSLFEFGLRSLWPLAIGFCIVLAFFVFLQWRPLRGKVSGSLVRHVGTAAAYVVRNRPIMVAMGANALVLMLSLSLLENWIAVFVPKLDATPVLLGIATIGVSLVRMASGIIFERVPALSKIGAEGSLLVLGIAVCLSGAVNSLAADVVAFIAALFAVTLVSMLLGATIYEHLPKDHAASVLSLNSLLENAGGGLALLSLYYLLKLVSIQRSWVLCGLALAAIGLAAIGARLVARARFAKALAIPIESTVK
jgi:hypothetical protein